MNTSVFNRRRAERFAQLLDEANGVPRHHMQSLDDDQLAPLVAVSDRLTAVRPSADLDPEFRTGLRAMLVATAEREGIGHTAVATAEPDPSRSRLAVLRLRSRGIVIVGVAASAVAISGMSAASGSAVPGDALYGVKRSTEKAQLGLAGSEVGRGQLLLDFARTRLTEAQAVRANRSGFAGALSDMDKDTRDGVKLLTTAATRSRDAAALDAIDGFVTDQRRGLTGLLDQVSGGHRDRVLESLSLLGDVRQRSTAIRETLACSASATAGADTLGPRPGTCLSTPSQSRGEGDRGSQTGQQGEAKPSPTRDGDGSEGDQREGATPKPDPTPSGGTPSDQPASTPSPTPDDGLLDGLGRILGDLLG